LPSYLSNLVLRSLSTAPLPTNATRASMVGWAPTERMTDLRRFCNLHAARFWQLGKDEEITLACGDEAAGGGLWARAWARSPATSPAPRDSAPASVRNLPRASWRYRAAAPGWPGSSRPPRWSRARRGGARGAAGHNARAAPD